MPVYEYRCRKCFNCYEVLVREPGAEKAVKCPACGSRRKSRLMSVFAAASGGRITSAGGAGCSSCGALTCATCGHK